MDVDDADVNGGCGNVLEQQQPTEATTDPAPMEINNHQEAHQPPSTSVSRPRQKRGYGGTQAERDERKRAREKKKRDNQTAKRREKQAALSALGGGA